jgi:trehalose synthase
VASPELVEIPAQPLERYRELLGDEYPRVEAVAERARQEFSSLTIWHVNSTAAGGGVAELLHALLPYVRGAGVDTRWVVAHGEPHYFTVTKRLHNRLHESPGDGGDLGRADREVYDAALRANAEQLEELIEPGDVVYLHDPQTAGLVGPMKEIGASVVWRCHVGIDRPGDLARSAWDFLRPYVEAADAYVFSRGEYVWDGLDRDKVWLMPPAIDPFSPKNEELDSVAVNAILAKVEQRADLVQMEPLPDDATLVAQVSRWDRLKDPVGLLRCFSQIDDPTIHLSLVGPASAGVADDPEGAAVYETVVAAWQALPGGRRQRARLVSLPMDDRDENAKMVNAIQRRADVIVQKSIAEGFGLTVSEAMWKRRPVVASRVGGIQDQIVDGQSGVLIDDPHDLGAFAASIKVVATDPALARRLGDRARERVKERFLAIGRLIEYVELVASLLNRL